MLKVNTCFLVKANEPLMTYTYSTDWNPSNTPRTLIYLLSCIAVISLCSALLDGIFVYYLEMHGPQYLLSLSWSGLRDGYLWQPLSYLFVLSSGNAGLSFSFFLELLFDLYIIWIMGTTLISRLGSAPFFRFYFFSGIATGLLTLLCMPLIHQYSELAGPSAPVYAIITVWTMLHPESELLLFFLVPVKAKWLFSGLLAIFLLTNLSHFTFIFAIFQLLSVLIAYLYATSVFGLKSPFSITDSIDQFFIDRGEQWRSFRFFKKTTDQPYTPPVDKEPKIYDFHSGSPILDDDAFMDNALEKILKFGENSLTWSERARMKKISEKKARNKDKNQ